MINKKMRVVEGFSGTSMQLRGLQNAKVFDIESIATIELDINAIICRAAVINNMTMDMVDNYEYPSREEMALNLTKLNIGYDFKKDKPYDWNKVARSKDSKKLLQRTWLACKLSNNLGDICGVESIPECDMFTYSSPCQSFSLAGTQEGINCTCNKCGHEFNPFDYDVDKRDKCPMCGSEDIQGTRSGQLAEVERLLVKAAKDNTLPTFLLMENVDALVSKKFKPDFEKWIARLDRLGYDTYYQVLDGKYCGVPQNRKRVFALSILKHIDNGKFEFPKPFDNGIRLIDVLDEDVDERFYINNERAQKLIDDLILNGKLEDEVA